MILSWVIQGFLVASKEDGGFQGMLRVKGKGRGGKLANGRGVSVNYINISGGNFDSGNQESLNFHVVILLLEFYLGEVIRNILYRVLSIKILSMIFPLKIT